MWDTISHIKFEYICLWIIFSSQRVNSDPYVFPAYHMDVPDLMGQVRTHRELPEASALTTIIMDTTIITYGAAGNTGRLFHSLLAQPLRQN